MKSVNELLDDLAEHISWMREDDHLKNINKDRWDKAQQLVGQIRYAYQYRCGPDES